MLVVCEDCSAKTDFSLLEADTPCPECGASGERLRPVTAAGPKSVDAPARTALIVEDDDGLRETYRFWLGDTPWEVREAADGVEALAELDSTVDVLVLDRELPDRSGGDVRARLVETEFDGSVLVVSAHDPDDDLPPDDVTGYLTKPVREKAFVGLLDQLAGE